MKVNLIKKQFPSKEMKLTNIYENPKLENFKTVGIKDEKVKDVYGTDLNFPQIPDNRPYIFGSFVTTVDGKLAYEDHPGAFEVAGRNHFAGDGSLTDFWFLNVLRSACDALILGAKSITLEEDYTGHCWDQDLEDARIKSQMPKIPLNIVVSTDASDIPLNHMLFQSKEIPSAIACAPEGLEVIEKEMVSEYVVVGPFETEKDINVEMVKEKFEEVKKGKVLVLLTGEGKNPNIKSLLKTLRAAGIAKLLVESPTYAHLLIKEEVFDEGFFNMSCVYIGGDAVSLGKFDQAFQAVYHPHTEVLSIGLHSPHMLFFRHKFIYGIETI